MGNVQLTRAPTPKEAPLIRPPSPKDIPDGLKSFTSFTKLPIELQANIFSLALENHEIIPRLIKTIFDKTTRSYSYSFAMPPLMITCHLSRQISKDVYPSLLPNSTCPIYFNPATDFLYCTSTGDLPYAMNEHEVEPVMSFLESSPIVAKIRFLVLDSSYWTSHISDMFSQRDFASMPELQLFTGIEELFLVAPSLEQELANKRRAYGRIMTNNVEFHQQRLDRACAAVIKSDVESPLSIVPGFRVYSIGTPCFNRRWELERAFGITTLELFGGGWSKTSNSGLFRAGKLIPRYNEIRALLK
ncbi:uncharacterized protein LY89DRAFT_714778 [Mollisia scopiformis]|uniref:2EXR domain-containing protein n=1 Tax=Mollisia scopiformis TaxID=149040 RepID=A0A194XPP9_MOLSC|nr:uncharacterized protein LY89DRAFT_714778 [Mollisia scopiformis]KUJ21717.1 hypothetical protein LY89DRAFT_714778 [Mollisia scopiformis]